MNSTDAFLKFFKGLYIEAQDLPQGGHCSKLEEPA
jgi:hypothetical protein